MRIRCFSDILIIFEISHLKCLDKILKKKNQNKLFKISFFFLSKLFFELLGNYLQVHKTNKGKKMLEGTPRTDLPRAIRLGWDTQLVRRLLCGGNGIHTVLSARALHPTRFWRGNSSAQCACFFVAPRTLLHFIMEFFSLYVHYYVELHKSHPCMNIDLSRNTHWTNYSV
jgi:hypothetical protein